MLKWTLVVLFAALWGASQGAIDSRIQVDPITRHFVNEAGETVIFHGANNVKKYPPFYPSMTEEEVDRFAADWGFNLLRLGLSWEALEPVQGEYNMTYLSVLKDIVRRFEERGVYSIIDMHQDLYSAKICGNGFPDWSVKVDPVVERIAPFPMPVLGRTVFEYGPDGRISGEDCGKLPYWSFIYFTAVTGSAFQSLYENSRGVQTAFIDAWTLVAKEFAGMKSVVGLELINEPWPGRIYTEPGLLLKPGYADAKNLVPLYEKLHTAIRAYDNETVIFYEPHVSTTQVLPFSAGFEVGPGGPEFNDRQVYTYHYYCPAVDASGVPTGDKYCEWFLEKSMEVRMADRERIGGASLLSEFGVFADSQDAIVELNAVSSIADRYLQSWAYWDYGVITGLKLDPHVSHTYPRRTAGVPLSFSFDTETSEFTMVYSASSKPGLETEIFLREKSWYSSGFTVSIKPDGVATWSRARENFLIFRHTTSVVEGQQITILIQKI